MVEALAWVSAVLLVLFGVRRLARWRVNGPNSANARAQFYVCGFAVCMGLSFVVLSPTPWDWVARTTSSTVALLLGDGLRRASQTFLALTSLWLGTGRATPRLRESRLLGAAVTVELVSCVLLVLARPVITGSGQLVVHGTGRWLLAGYNALFTVYALWCLALLARSLTAHSRGTGPGPVRFGLRLLAAAVLVGMVWIGWSVDDVVDAAKGGSQGGSDDPLSILLGAVCALLTTAGATATLWGVHLLAPVRWWRAWHSHRAIHPLWAALHAELPQIALQPLRSGPHVLPWEAEFALYRRVIEIRDATLVLRPYAPASVAASPQARQPAAEAAALAQALANYRAGLRTHSPAGPAGSPPELERAGNGSLDARTGTLATEVRWLAQVAQEFRRHPATHAPSSADPGTHDPDILTTRRA